MALQLLKRNYTMQGYEAPKILKLPQGEYRETPRRLPVDIGDVMMKMRMNDGENKYIGEHISKYAQGINPYGEFGQPYKINKNNIRPPIIDPKFYEPLSRMPVKFDSITAGPIVKNLYNKKIEIDKIAPRTIMDKVCPSVKPTFKIKGKNYTDNIEDSIKLHLRQPRTSIPYHPSMPIHKNTGVPEIELSGKMMVRPQMGIHFPYHVSDQSRDYKNMRTPMHVASKPGGRADYLTSLNIEKDIELTPKVKTSAWYNPNYNLTDLSGYSIQQDKNCIDNKVKTSTQAPVNYKMIDHSGYDVPITTRTPLNMSTHTNVSSRLLQEGELGNISLDEPLHYGEFEAKAQIPTIQDHQSYNRVRENRTAEYFYVDNNGITEPETYIPQQRTTGIRNRLQIQKPRVERTGLQPNERVVPVGTNRFVYSTV